MNGLAERRSALDFLLFDVCDNLQLTATQHGMAESRYHAIAKVISGANSPFSHWDSNLYSQGSMRLRTTVKPIDLPHDLDLVCEFDVSHHLVNPMVLLDDMYGLFKDHGVYGGMVVKKNRCVRVEYKDEFWLDILPACRDDQNGGTCILVPDRDLGYWKPSNPIAYAERFKSASRRIVVKFSDSRRDLVVAESTVEPLPALQATEEKAMLQLVVQLLKRWRDVHYADSDYPPISIVLTTLAAELYAGEQSLSVALLDTLEGIVKCLDASHAQDRRLQVLNPVHREEDFSERWDTSPAAYWAFDKGIRKFAKVWREVCLSQNNPGKLAKSVFGTVIDDALIREARMMQDDRNNSLLGIASTGRIVSRTASITPMLRNTNHGLTKVTQRCERPSVAHQIGRMRTKYPALTFELKRNTVVWMGEWWPYALSDTYRIRVSYSLGQRPRIAILSPALGLALGKTNLPHTYAEGQWDICVHRPEDWNSSCYIADTIMPWISQWLRFYEVWEQTGSWEGEGTHPQAESHKRKDA